MQAIIIDDEKKEAKIVKIIMICTYVLLFTLPLPSLLFSYLKSDDMTAIIKDLVLSEGFIVLFIFGLLCLYTYIYAIKYRVEIFEDKVLVFSLFGKKEMCFKDIIEWESNKYAFSNLFIIKVYLVNNKKKTVCTRYINEFKAILNEYKKNNIAEQNSNDASV